MAASARISGTSAPAASSLKRGSWASRKARAAAAARAARRFRDADEVVTFDEAGAFLRLSFFVEVSDVRDADRWAPWVSDGSPKKTTAARRQRTRENGAGRNEITGSNSLESSRLQRSIGILTNNLQFARVLTPPGKPTVVMHSLSKKGAISDEPA